MSVGGKEAGEFLSKHRVEVGERRRISRLDSQEMLVDACFLRRNLPYMRRCVQDRLSDWMLPSCAPGDFFAPHAPKSLYNNATDFGSGSPGPSEVSTVRFCASINQVTHA